MNQMPRGIGRNKFTSVNGGKKQRICDGRARGGRWQGTAVEMKEQVGRDGRNKCNTGGFHSISLLAVKAEYGTHHVCSHTSHSICRTSALPQPSSAFLEQTLAAFLELQSFREPQLGSHWWRTSTFFEEKWSQWRFSWLLQQTCYYLCFLAWCKCPTPSH